jgi:hypothetical protein
MKIWKTPDGHLLWEGQRHTLHSVCPIQRTNGEILEESAEYYKATEAGDIVTVYSAPLTSSLEDDLYVVNIHLVIESTLYRFMWRERYGGDTELNTEIEIGGLVPFAGTTLPFDPAPAIEAHQRRMAPKPLSWTPPQRQRIAAPDDSVFAHLEEVYARLIPATQGYIVAVGMVERLAPLIDALEAAHQTAAGMEIGAESFDNREAARSYRRARERLAAAAQEIAAACESLLG